MRNKMTPVVAEDQIENVGIMQGFMDGIEEMMSEIDADMAPDPDDVDGIAMILGRTPDSPEILMNNLRGDYRSVDARREELADLVGYNAAAETPDQVLALLQPVLAQQMAQGIGAIEPPPMPMGDMPMPDGGIGGLPAPMDPMMAMQQDPMMQMQMQQDPMMAMQQDPMMAMQQDPMMGAPVPMAAGGMVQRFEEGSGPAGVTRSSPSALDEFLARQGKPSIDLMARTKELSPAYRELLGLGAGADRSGMAFDIAQAALGYAANIGPDGQPLRGSGAARLASAARALPGQIGARAEAARQDETRARLAALGTAQAEQEAVQASNLALSAEQRAILLEREKQADPTTGFQTLHQRALAGGLEPGTEDYQRFMIDGAQQAGFSLSIDPDTGKIQFSQGGRPGVSSPSGIGPIPSGMMLVTNADGEPELRPIPGSPGAGDQEEAERKALARRAQIARAGGTVIQDLQRALDLIPELGPISGTEGVPGGISRSLRKIVPGSLEYQITEFTESALSNVGLDVLQQMRDNSPTGGALGQVPIQQQKRLEQVFGSLNINQRPEQLEANIQRVINIYTDIIHGSPMERAAAVEDGRLTLGESMEIDGLYFELPFDERGRAIDNRAQPVVPPRPTRLVYDAQGNRIQ